MQMTMARKFMVICVFILALLIVCFIASSFLLPPRAHRPDTLVGEGWFAVFDENSTLIFNNPTTSDHAEFEETPNHSFIAKKHYNITAGEFPKELEITTNVRYGTGSGRVIFNFRINFSLVSNNSTVLTVNDDMTGSHSTELGPAMSFFGELRYSLYLNSSGLFAESTNSKTKNDYPWTNGKFVNASALLVAGNYTFIVEIQSDYMPSSFSDPNYYNARYDAYTVYSVEYAQVATFDYLVVLAVILSFLLGALLVYVFTKRMLYQLHGCTSDTNVA